MPATITDSVLEEVYLFYSDEYGTIQKNRLSLIGAISLGIGVMIGAGIFALLRQVAEFSGKLFPAVFIVGAAISGLSAYSYIKLSNTFPSAGGIAVFLYPPLAACGLPLSILATPFHGLCPISQLLA